MARYRGPHRPGAYVCRPKPLGRINVTARTDRTCANTAYHLRTLQHKHTDYWIINIQGRRVDGEGARAGRGPWRKKHRPLLKTCHLRAIALLDAFRNCKCAARGIGLMNSRAVLGASCPRLSDGMVSSFDLAPGPPGPRYNNTLPHSHNRTVYTIKSRENCRNST